MPRNIEMPAEQTPDLSTALEAAPKRGRPPYPNPEALPESPVSEADRATLGTALDMTRKVDAAVNAVIDQSVTLAEITGKLQTFRFMRSICTLGDIKLLSDLKERKLYKGATVKSVTGEIVITNTFEDYCKAIGISRRIVDENIQNLNTLGEEYLEACQGMGLGYREIRQLRAISSEDRPQWVEGELMIDGEKVGNDPEALKDHLIELAAKRIKEKEELAQKLKESQADLDARSRLLAEKNSQLDATRSELHKLQTLPPDQQVLLQDEQERNALSEIHNAGLYVRGAFSAFLARVTTLQNLEDVDGSTLEMVTQLTSGLCSHMANALLKAGVDIDFRILTYPLSIGDLPLRGDGNTLGADEEQPNL